jgi:predicted amidohydrolase YtcJ
MCQDHKPRLTRRDFLLLGGAALGGAVVACGGNARVLEITAVPTPANARAPAPTPAPAATPTAAPVAASPAAPPTPVPAPGPAADTILVNGNIVLMDPKRAAAQALAIKDGLIMQVGDEQAVRGLAGESSQVIDLRGRTVTPGLIDAHCHLSACGLLGTVYADINWPAVKTIPEMQAVVAEWVAKTPPGEWVVGAGWLSYEGRYPNKHDLDPVSPKHPVMLINQGGHMAAVNSFALELAGVNANTPDPRHGVFMREANNEPDGTIVNHPTMDIFRRLWPRDMLDVQAMEASILSPQARFAAMGVTSFQDVYARDMDRMQAYFNVARRHEMSIRGQVMNVLEYIQELKGRIEAIEAMRYEDDFMHFAGAKFQMDGALEASFTHEPHDGMAWNVSIWDPQDINEAVKAFHDAGYQVACHAIGDAAVDMALDAIEAAMNANPRPDPRHRIEHAVLNTDAALQRTKDLGVVISTQPQAIRLFADALEEIWGPERAQHVMPTRTWLDMGVPLALSSDAPSMPWWDPQTTLFGSIARYSATKKPVSPEQALTIEEAMYAHTMGGAYADFAEKVKGSLEPGKFADLVVWHDNPFTAQPADLLKLKADLTMVGGKVLHQA